MLWVVAEKAEEITMKIPMRIIGNNIVSSSETGSRRSCFSSLTVMAIVSFMKGFTLQASL